MSCMNKYLNNPNDPIWSHITHHNTLFPPITLMTPIWPQYDPSMTLCDSQWPQYDFSIFSFQDSPVWKMSCHPIIFSLTPNIIFCHTPVPLPHSNQNHESGVHNSTCLSKLFWKSIYLFILKIPWLDECNI